MLSIDTKFFLNCPEESSQRILHPATVVEVNQDIYLSELEEKDLSLDEAQNIIVYYDIRGQWPAPQNLIQML